MALQNLSEVRVSVGVVEARGATLMNCPDCGEKMVQMPTFDWERKLVNDYYLCLNCRHREQVTFDESKMTPDEWIQTIEMV